MKCKICGQTAVINMRQHRLSLCRDHFVAWVPRHVARTIDRYHMFGQEDRILLAVSGGKDSLALWDILLGLGYQVDGIYINLGIGPGYSDESQRRVESFAANRPEARLRIVSLEKEYGASVPELVRARRGRKACSLCGLIKRHIMNEAASQGGYAAIVTGHNLDDEVAVLLQNTLHWNVGYLARQGPVLPEAPGLARKVKPLCRMREREMAAYALVRGIDYIYEECPHATGATSLLYKELLTRLDARSPGTKEMYYLEFLKAREEHGLFHTVRDHLEMQACPRCGQATTVQGLCAFCRLWAAR